MLFSSALAKVDWGNFLISSEYLQNTLRRDDLRIALKSKASRDAYLGAAKGSSCARPLRVLLGTGPESYNRALTGPFEAKNGIFNYALSLNQKALRGGLGACGSLIGTMLSLAIPNQENAAGRGREIGRRLGDSIGNEVGCLFAGILGAAVCVFQSVLCVLGASTFVLAGLSRKSWPQSNRSEELGQICQNLYFDACLARWEADEQERAKKARYLFHQLQGLRQEITDIDVAARKINARNPKPMFRLAEKETYSLIGLKC